MFDIYLFLMINIGLMHVLEILLKSLRDIKSKKKNLKIESVIQQLQNNFQHTYQWQ